MNHPTKEERQQVAAIAERIGLPELLRLTAGIVGLADAPVADELRASLNEIALFIDGGQV